MILDLLDTWLAFSFVTVILLSCSLFTECMHMTAVMNQDLAEQTKDTFVSLAYWNMSWSR